MSVPADPELVAALKRGDERLFEQVVAQYQRSLLKLATMWVRTPAAAEEAVQDTWLAVVRGLPSFQGRSSFKTWLFTILANRARTRAVRESRFVPLSAALDPGDDEAAGDEDRWTPRGRWARPPADWRLDSAEHHAITHELAGVVEAALEDLPPAQRAVVVLRDIETVEATEACTILGITPTHQRVLLHRGRTRLRAAVEAHLTGSRTAHGSHATRARAPA
ncbi:MAG: RNA polymerase sigma factor [Vicinamibacterales bacterium]